MTGEGLGMCSSQRSQENLFLGEFLSLEIQDKTGKAHLYFLLKDRLPVPEISIHHFERHAGGKEDALLRPPWRSQVICLPSFLLNLPGESCVPSSLSGFERK